MAETRNPGEPLLHYNKALLYYRMKDYLNGIDAISRSLRLHPTHPESAQLRFDLYRGIGREWDIG